MLWPIDAAHAENSIIPNPTGSIMVFPKSKDAKMLAPLSGMVVKVDPTYIIIETLSQSSKTKITTNFMNFTADPALKEGVFINEGQPIGVAGDNLNWFCFIKDAVGERKILPLLLGGLLGGLYFAGDSDNNALGVALTGLREDFGFIAKVGFGSFLAGVGVGIIAPKLLK